MGQHNTRIAQQPAPVAGVVTALAQIECEVEVACAARTKKNCRPTGLQTWAVRGDEHIGGQQFLLLLANFTQPRRANLFAGFDQHLKVKAQTPALFKYRIHRSEVDRVLAFVVCGAAPVQTIAFVRDRPWRQAAAPLLVLSANHVAVTIGQHRWQGGIFEPLGNQKRPAFARRIGQDRAAKPL